MFEASGIPVASYHAVAPSYRHPAPFLQSSRELAEDFGRRRIDVVHCSDLLGGYYAVLAARFARIPVLCHVRCIFDDISRRDQSFLWWIDHFVFVSESVRAQFAYRAGAASGSVIYDGIPIPDPPPDSGSVRAEFGISSDAPLIGMVARIAPAKDYATLGKAAAIILRAIPEARFLMVVFTGHRQDVSRLTAAVDVIALATHGEGVPLSLLEAMALGKPVVATGIGGVLDLIRDQETGLLHRHEDAEQLAAALLSLLQNPDRARELGKAGFRDVQNRFSPRANASALTALYRKLARRKIDEADAAS
jgi:glycosyltransferase involved in cell wall biosynthesis